MERLELVLQRYDKSLSFDMQILRMIGRYYVEFKKNGLPSEALDSIDYVQFKYACEQHQQIVATTASKEGADSAPASVKEEEEVGEDDSRPPAAKK